MATKSAKQGELPPSKTKRVLVVGDWIIDDYWVTGIHRSLTASRIGRSHFRALNNPNTTVQALVGAGRVASLLRSATLDGKEVYSVVGLGLWHKNDTVHLRAMFNRANLRGWTPHQINRTYQLKSVPSKVALVNLADLLSLDDGRHGTTRVVRVYRQTGSTLELLGRLDWELPPEGWERTSDRAWLNEKTLPTFQKKSSERRELNQEFDAVVIKDLAKGVVSDLLIGWLAETYPNSAWFVSSKEWNPSWLQHLGRVNLRLLLIPQIAARQAVRENAVFSWFTRSSAGTHKPTKEAIEALDGVIKERGLKDASLRLIALPEGYSVLAREVQGRRGVCQPAPEPVRFRKNAAMASAFFSDAIASLLTNSTLPLERVVEFALGYVDSFAAIETDWLLKPDDSAERPEPPIILDIRDRAGSTVRAEQNPTVPKPSVFPFSTIGFFDWRAESKRWERAHDSYGIIEADTPDQEDVIELWRAMTEITGYVCCLKEKRSSLAGLLNKIKSLSELEGRLQENVSAVLIANPGSGKTSLVRALADTFQMRLHDFNITQLVTREQVIDCFDTIVASQIQEPRQNLVVFFDEVDSRLDNQNVYDLFLSPIEEGVYVRGGKKYYMRPCVWLFAATAKPTENLEAVKAKDFESRLTMKYIDLTASTDIERVYRGVSMIQRAFPDVRYVSKRILELFHELRETSPRELNRLIKSFQGVKDGRISGRNVPIDLRKKLTVSGGIGQTDVHWVRIV